MKITHVYHSCFLAELEHSLLLFDWYKRDLPVLPADKKLYVFCSHVHEDHYNAQIWDLQKYAMEKLGEDYNDVDFHRIILDAGPTSFSILKERVDEYDQLEREATILRELMPVPYRTTYNELIYHPVRIFANLYNMYYAVAMNGYYASKNDLRANQWADKVELCFRRDAELCDEYNHKIAGGKWNHMMDEIHIGYRSWNNPPRNTMPQVKRVPRPTRRKLVGKLFPILVYGKGRSSYTPTPRAPKELLSRMSSMWRNPRTRRQPLLSLPLTSHSTMVVGSDFPLPWTASPSPH